MAGESVEITTKRLHIYRKVCGTLCTIHQHQGTGVVTPGIGNNLLHRVDSSQCIRDIRHCHQFRTG